MEKRILDVREPLKAAERLGVTRRPLNLLRVMPAKET
jgi:hypothetical protein